MMYLKVEEIGDGLHPSEAVVAIATTSGRDRLVVPRQAIFGGKLQVGYPIKTTLDDYLIELPRETQSGAWRVWVNKSQLLEPERKRA